MIITHVPPPPPPAIVQTCAYQIEVNDTGRRTYKCLTEKEHNDILTENAKRDEEASQAIQDLITSWKTYTVLFVIFLLWFFWPRSPHDYQPFENW